MAPNFAAPPPQFHTSSFPYLQHSMPNTCGKSAWHKQQCRIHGMWIYRCLKSGDVHPMPTVMSGIKNELHTLSSLLQRLFIFVTSHLMPQLPAKQISFLNFTLEPNHFPSQGHFHQLMVNSWFGARWFGSLGVHPRIPIPFIFGDSRNPNHRDPNQQPKP